MNRLLFAICFSMSALTALGQKVQLPQGYTAQMNVVYTRVGPWEGKMDLYLPPACKICKLAPVVVHIHGGGFTHGSKESQADFGVFFEMGFAVANISYRLAKIAPAPAAIEDVRCAVAYLAQNASTLNIDPTKIVTRGSSAGGHLALMAGLLCSENTFANHCPNARANVAAIVGICPPTDLTKWDATAKKANKATRAWLGRGENDTSFMLNISPITYVGKNSPPVFIAHGSADKTVPLEQSQLLVEKLISEGVYVDFYTVENGEHEFTRAERNAVNKAMAEFLKKVLDW
jgi:acetyl esterase/lipase